MLLNIIGSLNTFKVYSLVKGLWSATSSMLCNVETVESRNPNLWV